MKNILIIAYIACSVSLFDVFLPEAYSSPGLMINEYMGSNETVLDDEDGDFQDWIEIYNSGEVAINLKNYGLTDNAQNLNKWQFPDIELATGEFILVWASGKDRRDPNSALHTNFSISSKGEDLVLTLPDSTIIDYIPATTLPTDISFGRKPDGETVWQYFSDPTPGMSNVTEGFTEILSPPIFSQQSGFYTSGFTLNITTTEPVAQIIYTIDGSEPNENNLTGTTFFYKKSFPQHPGNPAGPLLASRYVSHLYQNPLPITDRSFSSDSLTHKSSTYHYNPYYFPTSPVFKGTVVRARTIKPGALPGEIVSHVYFVHPQGRNRYSLTVINLSTNPDYLFDYYKGIYTPGIDFDNWRNTFPNATAVGNVPANYHRRGNEWEYPAHFSLFEPQSSELSYSTDIGYRMHGAWSRSFPYKTLRLFARSQREDNKFQYPIFPDQPYNSYKRLLLRNSGNDYYYTKFRDAVIQKLMEPLRFDVQAYRPAILFLNGEYWGIHNLRERYDKFYLERVYGVDPEKIDILEWNGEILEGENQHYFETLNYITQNDINSDSHYEYIKTRIDIDNYIDYQIANIFIGNLDWPGNNIEFWRYQTAAYNPDAPYGQDGRWRWMAFDTDFGLGLYDNPVSHNTLAFATEPNSDHWGNPPWSTLLLRNLLGNDIFKQEFITRFSDLLNTIFLPEHINSIIDNMSAEIEPEMPETIKRWRRPENMTEWYYHINTMKSFANDRSIHQWNHLQGHFNLPPTATVNLNVNNPNQGYIKINTVEIQVSAPGVSVNPYPWQGKYFKNQQLTIKAVHYKNYSFSHWTGDFTGNNAEINITLNSNVSLTAHYKIDPQPELVHYWYFNTDIQNDTPLTSIAPYYSVTNPKAELIYHSSLAGYPFDAGHPLWRKGSMERRNLPTSINYHPGAVNGLPFDSLQMRAIQIKQPFTSETSTSEIVFHMPTQGFRDLVFTFAAITEGRARQLFLDYAIETAGEINFQPKDTFDLGLVYQLFQSDFSAISEVADNPYFIVRIRVEGDLPGTDEGNRITFNNISLYGTSLTTGITHQFPANPTFMVYPNPISAGQELQLGKQMDINLYTINGQLVFSQKNVGKIALDGLVPGMYFLSNSEGQLAKIIIVE